MLEVLVGHRVYLDANVFVYAVEGYSGYDKELKRLFTALDNGFLTAVTSELTLAEVLIKPIMDGNVDLQQMYKDHLQSDETLIVAPVNRVVLLEAAQLRAMVETLKLPDAIHFATAILEQCGTFLTNDTRFRAVKSGPTVVLLSDACGQTDSA